MTEIFQDKVKESTFLEGGFAFYPLEGGA